MLVTGVCGTSDLSGVSMPQWFINHRQAAVGMATAKIARRELHNQCIVLSAN